MCFFDFIEQENALPVFAKDSSQTSRAAGFVSHQRLHIVQVQEFRHVKPEHGTLTEQLAGKFQCPFRLPYSGRSEKQERAKRSAIGRKPNWPRSTRKTRGNYVLLTLDLGR